MTPQQKRLDDMETIYRKIKGYVGVYVISNYGEVIGKARHVKRGNHTLFVNKRHLKQSKSYKGYLFASLSLGDGTCKKVSVARLVAKTFIPNPKNLPQVNHKNMIKTDNSVQNLEWCTGSYNQLHGRANNKNRKPMPTRKVLQINPLTNEVIQIFDSTRKAAENLNCYASSITDCINHERCKTAHGYKWEYENKTQNPKSAN